MWANGAGPITTMTLAWHRHTRASQPPWFSARGVVRWRGGGPGGRVCCPFEHERQASSPIRRPGSHNGAAVRPRLDSRTVRTSSSGGDRGGENDEEPPGPGPRYGHGDFSLRFHSSRDERCSPLGVTQMGTREPTALYECSPGQSARAGAWRQLVHPWQLK